MPTLIIPLALTVVIAAGALLAGFIAAMPDGTIARGVTPRLRIELYLGATACLYLTGQVWLAAAPAIA